MSDEKKTDLTEETKAEQEAAKEPTNVPDGLTPEEEAELETAEKAAEEYNEMGFLPYS